LRLKAEILINIIYGFHLAIGAYLLLSIIAIVLMGPNTISVVALTVGVITITSALYLKKFKPLSRIAIAISAIINVAWWLEASNYLNKKATENINNDQVGPNGLMVDHELSIIAIIVACIFILTIVAIMLPSIREYLAMKRNSLFNKGIKT
jgi:hypothetical protein